MEIPFSFKPNHKDINSSKWFNYGPFQPNMIWATNIISPQTLFSKIQKWHPSTDAGWEGMGEPTGACVFTKGSSWARCSFYTCFSPTWLSLHDYISSKTRAQSRENTHPHPHHSRQEGGLPWAAPQSLRVQSWFVSANGWHLVLLTVDDSFQRNCWASRDHLKGNGGLLAYFSRALQQQLCDIRMSVISYISVI